MHKEAEDFLDQNSRMESYQHDDEEDDEESFK